MKGIGVSLKEMLNILSPLYESGVKTGAEAILQWGDELCPHGTLTRRCDICWQGELKKGGGGR